MSGSAADIAGIAVEVGAACEKAGLRYFVGGSVASSLHGVPRFTNDVDIVVEMEPADVPRLVSALGPDYEVDEESLTEAIRRRRSWNIFHLPTAAKVDLFIASRDAFDESRLARRRSIEPEPGRHVFVSSAEDTILRKLLWYRAGGETSERQWLDVVEMIRVQGDKLDNAYLDEWGHRLGTSDLLSQARADSRRSI